MERLPAVYSEPINQNYLLAAVSISLVCVGLTLWSPISFAVVLGVIFVGIFFVSRTFRWAVFPTILIFNQFIFRNAGISFTMGGFTIQPIDWIAALLIVTGILQSVFTRARFWVRTGLETPIWIFLGAIAFGLFNAADLKAGIINWGHTVLYFIAFYAMVADWEGVSLHRIWRAYFFWAIVAALSSLWQFFSSGGGRSLGLAGIPLNHLVIPVLSYELARLSLWGRAKSWCIVAVFVATAIATQTRGLWLSVGVLLAVWFISAFLLKPFPLFIPRNPVVKLILLVLVLALLFSALVSFLGQVEERAEQLVQQSGTVYLRLFLWGAAWQLFQSHPVLGVGMGQFAGAVQQFPESKNLSIFVWTHGLSAHHQLLSLLAETGLIGGFAFLTLLVWIVWFSQRNVRMARNRQDFVFGWGLFLIFSVFAISILFAGTWQYEFAFFLALLVLQRRKLEPFLENVHGH